MEGFVFSTGVRRGVQGARTCGRRATVMQESAGGEVASSSVTELEKALKSVRCESKKLEKALAHLKKVEKELEKATMSLSGKDESSSSSSGDEKCQNMDEKKKMKKMEKMQRKQMEKARDERRQARLEESKALEVGVCTGNACVRSGAQQTLAALEDLSTADPRLVVEECSCLGMCKGSTPTVRYCNALQAGETEATKHKESTEATLARVKMELADRATDVTDSGSESELEVAPAKVAELAELAEAKPTAPRPGTVVITGREPVGVVVEKLFAGL